MDAIQRVEADAASRDAARIDVRGSVRQNLASLNHPSFNEPAERQPTRTKEQEDKAQESRSACQLQPFSSFQTLAGHSKN